MLSNPLMVGNNQVPQVTDTVYLGVTITVMGETYSGEM